MKTTPLHAHSGIRRNAAGFTLVELLTVIAIIVLLVGITIPILGYANSAAARKKVNGQMELIITGLTNYKAEYGEYPEPVDNTGEGSGGAKALYQALSGDGSDFLVVGSDGGSPSNGKPGSTGEVFIEGLDPKANKHGLVAKSSGVYQLADAFAQPWHYRKFVKDDPSGDRTHNTTYDLWSVGLDKKRDNEAKWIKNW